MVLFTSWKAAAASQQKLMVVAQKMDRLRNIEAALLELAWKKKRAVGSTPAKKPSVRTVDTTITMCRNKKKNQDSNRGVGFFQSLLPNSHLLCEEGADDNAEKYTIHSIEVRRSSSDRTKQHHNKHHDGDDEPLVLLHGYMNGAAYFYRNFMGLSQYFHTIHSLDWLGWGLSSRPSLPSSTNMENNNTDAISGTEDFFVESLEAWRKQQNISKMKLAGHSMGAYLSVAYTERYPQHVSQLVLISPVGVPEETKYDMEQRQKRIDNSWRFRFFYGLYGQYLFPRYTVGDLLRTLPETTGRNYVWQYVSRRLPALAGNVNEQKLLSDYLYGINTLPGSGEYCLPQLLHPTVYGKRPLVHRIPKLQIDRVTFLYGDSDWMDSNGGLQVEQRCDAEKQRQRRAEQHQEGAAPPSQVDTFVVRNAGHLLMLDNDQEFNTAMALAAGRRIEGTGPLPRRLQAPKLKTNTAVANQENHKRAKEDIDYGRVPEVAPQ